MRAIGRIGGMIVLAIVLGGESANAAISGVQRLAVGSNLNFPSFATHAPGDRNRLFVTQLDGNIKILDLNNLNAAPLQFLNIADTDFSGEGGLLSMAFHPNYFASVGTPGRGKFYVYVTVDNGGVNVGGATSPFSTHIREYSVLGDPATSNVADTAPASIKQIVSWPRPQSNHVGGWIGFNPQVTLGQPQYLYISSGDGGGSNDNASGHTAGTGNAQDTTDNFFGKMLRLDINGDDFTGGADPTNTKNYAIPPTNPFVGVTGDDEIWAYGLRNPFRDSFDRQTGDMWIGDVGQDNLEEIDFQPASKTTATNYGWRLREGNIATPTPVGAPVGGAIPDVQGEPIYWYGRGSGPLLGETVIGGYRYRGPDPDLQGRYYFADASDDNTWQMIPTNPVGPGGAVTNIDASLGNLTGIERIVSYGEDAVGNLYLVDMATGANNAPNPNTGEVYRILTNKLVAGDYNADGDVNGSDYIVWRQTFGNTGAGLPADGNGNQVVDAGDYVVWRNNEGATAHVSAAGSTAALVPEPTAATIIVVSLVLLPVLTCRRRLPTCLRGL